MVDGYQVGLRPAWARWLFNTPTALWVGATTVQQSPVASAAARKRMDRKVLPVPA